MSSVDENAVFDANAEISITNNAFACNGVVLELLFDNGEVSVEQFGAVSDKNALETDTVSYLSSVNKNAIQAAINSGARKVNFSPAKYYVGEDIHIAYPVDIVGNGAELDLETDSTSTQLFRVEYASDSPKTAAIISDMTIMGTRVVTEETITDSQTNSEQTIEEITFYNYCINLVNASDVIISNINFNYGAYAVYAQIIDAENHSLSNICIKDCNVYSSKYAFSLSKVSGLKIQNCKADLDNVGLIGLGIRGNCSNVLVEDVSLLNVGYGVHIATNTWSSKATDRYVFKNLLVDGVEKGLFFVRTNVPVLLSNAVIVNVTDRAVHTVKAENISISNSSVVLAAPEACETNAVPLYIGGATKIKFSHVQFEFPFGFQYDYCNYSVSGEVNVSLVDCTLQKTDNALDNPKGFGGLGCVFGNNHAFIQTFDACEFRSYIQNYSADNMPFVLSTPNNSESKLIIKNSRFVNENTCTVPYFLLDDDAKFDNIVVYNCFFENYNGTENVGSAFPIFGRLVNGSIETSNEENGAKIHNIFAKCNMRSSAPVRNTGTTINEMVEYT